MKFTPRGEIRVTVRDEGSFVVVTVSDTGRGIAAAFLRHVFDIVRRLVELHCGTVAAESAGAGRGATFTVHLPYKPLEAVRATALEEQRQTR